MRKTRLVLIPGVKSLDTIGCLLLFLACPSIAFKGQENREVDTICKAQNLKEFWVDSPWPGDADNIGWVRGYGGGTWPGNSQKQHTCNDLSTRSIARSRRSDDRRVQVRREVSRDDGTETRKIRLENDMRRDSRREIINRRNDGTRNVRDSRRIADEMVLDEQRRTDSRRVQENRVDSRTSSRSSDREIRSERAVRGLDSRRDSFSKDRNDFRMRSAEQQTVTIRETIDGRRNSRVSTRNVDREIRFKREVRGPETRRTVLNRDSTDEVMSAERRTVRNREVIDSRRESRHSIQSHDARSERQIRNQDSRRASLTLERADSRLSDERVRTVERQNVDNRRVDEGTNSRLASRSLERGIRTERDVRELVSRRDSRFRERSNQRMPGETMRAAERGVMIALDRTFRSERDIRNLEFRRSALNRDMAQSREVDERRSVERRNIDSRRSPDDRRDSRIQNQRRDIRSERGIRELDSQNRNRMLVHSRGRTSERQTVSDREVVDGRSVSSRSLDREMRNKREVRGPEADRETRFLTRATNMNIREGRSIENTRIIENRRAARLSTRSLDRQIRSTRAALEVENHRNTQDRDSRRTDNFRSADEWRIDSRRERENMRESRQSVRSIERETRFMDAQRAERNVMNGMRNSRESTRTRRAAIDTRDSMETANMRSEKPRSVETRSQTEPRLSRSLDNIRSTEERRVDNRRLSMERRDSRLPTQSLERAVRSERETTDRRANTRDIRESRILALDARRSNDFQRAESRRNTRLSIRSSENQQSVSGPEHLNRETGVNRRQNEVEREARHFDRVSRRVGDVERVRERRVRDESRSPVRLQRSTRSLEDIRQYDSQIRRIDIGRESGRFEIRREVERENTRERRSLDRLARGTDERRNELRQARDQYSTSRRLQRLSRSSEDIRQSDRQTRLAGDKRETRRMDMRRNEGDQEARLVQRTNSERDSRHARGMERADIRDDTRSQLLTSRMQRDVRSVGDIRRSDRLTQRADIKRVNRIVDNRRNEIDRETKNAIRASSERLSRLAEHAHPELVEARVLDVRRFERQMPSTQDRRETTRADSRRREAEDQSRNYNRATPERMNRRLGSTETAERLTRDESRSQHLSREREIRLANERRAITERESRRLDRRETEHENKQRRLMSADFRRFDKRDSRDTEIRRISRDVSLKFESTQALRKESRRSERQRRADVERALSRFADKRRDNTFTTESIRRFDEITELTNKPRRMLDIRERYAGKTNAMEREYDQKLSNKGENSFFESSKNALASWLTTDISRTDLNGIAETLMYGGIACFALFSNVNKKVIF